MIPTTEDLKLQLDSQVRVGLERADLLRGCLKRLFGLTHEARLVADARGWHRVIQGAELPGGPTRFESLAEAYTLFTGDVNFQRVGMPRIVQLSIPDFPAAMADTLNSLLVQDFAVEYRWRDLVTEFTTLENFRPQDRVRVGYVEDLPNVGDDAAYDEISSHSDEKYTLAVNQKGGTLTVTRRMIINDNIGAIKRLVEQAGRAAWRTVAKRVWNLAITNAIYGADGLGWFHNTHANLGSAALSVASLTAARNAIFAQKEPGSAERMGLGSGPLLLAIPLELEATALPINTCEYIPGSATFEGNPWKGRFGANNERIFANPLFEDANDWYLFDISGNVGNVEIGFLNGQQSPQIFVSRPDTDQGLTQDRIVYKIRHEYEAAVRDFRGSYKAVVG